MARSDPQEIKVDTHHLFVVCLVMASLKSFLYGLAPILGMTGAALYERQRSLIALGVLEATPGRGPGSGVPLTADNIAAVVISVLAAENLSEIDKDVVALCKARPSPALIVQGQRIHPNSPGITFKTEVGRALSGKTLASAEIPFTKAHSISVSRPWRGQITVAPGESIEFATSKRKPIFTEPITITAEIEYDTLTRLIDFTRGALSQLAEEENEE
jgi:hypothetical protein